MRADRQTDRQRDRNADGSTPPFYQGQTNKFEFEIAIHKTQAVYTL